MAEARTMFLAERLVASSLPATSGKGMQLGMGKTVQFTETRVILDAGDIVVFYTDGLTEAAN
jgi:serine phosphatase RsbU (regulator of sigma subunit)